MKFFNFSQNHSGDYFVRNEEHGVGEEIIIEANTWDEAWEKLSGFQNKVEGFFEYCSCCGERWSDWGGDDDGKTEPMIYDTPVGSYKKQMFRKKVFIHYDNGTFKKVDFK